MTRLLLPRTLAAIWTDHGQDGTVGREGVAVLAMDTTKDAYLLIARDGNSYWAPITDVTIVDDTILFAANKGHEVAATIGRERSGAAA
jgi:hypothetical protein